MIQTALYSFWSKPYLLSDFKKYAEFNNKKDFVLSWKTSVNLSKKFFKNVILITDDWSWENIFKDLNLPFDDVKLILNINISEKLWSISKAYAIKNMTEPFLHIDSDVYIWKKLNNKILNSELLVQSEENFDDKNQYLLYHSMYWEYNKFFKGSNKYLDKFNPNKRKNYAYNTGVIGGNDLKFLHNYADNMIDIFNIYNEYDNLGNLNVAFLEQTLLLMMSEKYNINTNFIIEKNIKQDYYTHLAGDTKRNKKIMEYLEIKYNSIQNSILS